MSGVQVAVPLQVICRLMVAGQVYENTTLSSNQNSSLAETIGSRVLPPGYVSFPEYGVAYKHFNDKVTQNEARKMCLRENAQLAVIDSREKVEKISNQFRYDEFIWVGLSIFRDTSEWTTIDGKSTNNLPWSTGEPTEAEKCAVLSRKRVGLVSANCNFETDVLCEIALTRN